MRGLFQSLGDFVFGWLMSEIIIPQDLYTEIVAAARAGYPEEICGLVAGVNNRAARLYPVENILHSPVAYEMNPLEQIKAMLAIEAQGMEMLAIYHSHPNGPAFPSATDIALAFYPDALTLIVSLEEFEKPVMGAFAILDGKVSVVDWRSTVPDSGE